jgi:hypothetical protein
LEEPVLGRGELRRSREKENEAVIDVVFIAGQRGRDE